MKISELASFAGVTVRTLHYYDKIGLLKPCQITEAGYRIYNDEEIERLQHILFFKELDFPLSEIIQIMASPSFDKHSALKKHKAILIKKRARLSALITLVNKTIEGEKIMSFKEFDTTDIERTKAKYASEAKQHWGHTEEFAQSEQKTSEYSHTDWQSLQNESSQIFDKFASLRDGSPSCNDAQKLVAEWQSFITKKFYNCTNEILQGLGGIYISDKRFTENIDKSGAVTAEFIARAIAAYCAK